ncbi:MAG: hypothetical protein H6976_13365 [Gammaproteobacteria bacterium]|nr:hypothetical protein [Gammaproteobacteria bacterium]
MVAAIEALLDPGIAPGAFHGVLLRDINLAARKSQAEILGAGHCQSFGGCTGQALF